MFFAQKTYPMFTQTARVARPAIKQVIRQPQRRPIQTRPYSPTTTLTTTEKQKRIYQMRSGLISSKKNKKPSITYKKIVLHKRIPMHHGTQTFQKRSAKKLHIF